MKNLRHAMIKEIIAQEIIETQEDLADALRAHDIQVTQATVSRDIKELMLIKIPIGDGRYRYASPTKESVIFTPDRVKRLFEDTVTSVDMSENIVVVKTLPGSANTVAAALDHADWSEIIGTVAGDDNILVVAKPKTSAKTVAARIRELMNDTPATQRKSQE
ncbi:MAG: arginine repressor [Selenomonadaceae bacterium]|nr:arginine repressor [Selenomonadaceae bacterium]MDD7057150.1 arginine repressor [Selenomonadaceae bacterium]MDY3916848.1 arginine repressor [Selenomonadaceae bacterium]